jgi:hypothetical protein
MGFGSGGGGFSGGRGDQDGDLTVRGTTPQITIGDAGAEDTFLIFDGNAADYRIGIDDGTDILEIGAGTAHGTTAAIKINSSGQITQLGHQTSPTNGHFLKWDGSKIIFDSVSAGGGADVGLANTFTEAQSIAKDQDSELVALILKNASDANDTSGLVSLRFDLEDTGGNAVDSAKIAVKKEAAFTATASTQDSSIFFSTSLNGTLTEQAKINSAGNLSILTDGAAVNFGADGEVTLTHVHDEGLLLTHTATGDNKPVTLTLKSEEDAIIADEVLGAINFKGGDSDGTDAILVAAGIEAVATDTHAADNNATKLAFKTAASEAATEKMTLTSDGKLGVGVTDPDSGLEVLNTSRQLKLSYDADSFYSVTVAQNSETTISTGKGGSETGNLFFDPGGDIILQPDGGDVKVGQAVATQPADLFLFSANNNGQVGIQWDADGFTNGALLGGVDDAGVDFKFFGATSGNYVQWDNSGDELVLGSNTKLSFHDAAGGENILASADGHLEVNAGTTLDITAPTVDINASTAVTIDGPAVTVASAADGKPVVTIKTTHTTTASSGELQFLKDAADTQDGEVLGQITFFGEDEGNNNTQFAGIVASISESDETDEAGVLELQVAESDGTTTAMTTGLKLEGEHATDGEVDVTIGAGTASTTTIVGTSQFNANATFGVDDTGVDVRFFSATASEGLLYDASEDELGLLLTTKLKFHDIGGGEEIFASADGHLEVNAGTTLDMTAPTIDLNASTAVTIDTDTATFASANANDPLVVIKNTANDATGARLQLVKDKGAAGAANDVNGLIQFIGDDANQDQVTFSEVKSQVKVHTNGQEGGKFTVSVAEHDGTLTQGLLIEDGDADGELDVTIGAGTASLTTVAGTSLFTSNATFGADDTGVDVRFFSATASEGLLYDASEDELGLLLTTKLKFHDIGGGEEIFASADGHLEVNAGTTLDLSAPTVDINGTSNGTVQIDTGSDGNFNVNSDTTTFASSASQDPIVIIKNTTNNAGGAQLQFSKDRGAAGQDGDIIGEIDFFGDDDAQAQTLFAQIKATVEDASNGAEGGKIAIGVATHDGEFQNGLVIEDGDAEDEVDVTIANGAASLTTISGTSLFSGNATFGVDDTGVDVRFFSATASEGVLYDASEDELGLLLTTKLKFHDIGGGEEIFASANGHLEINAGTTLDVTAPTVDINASTAVTIDTDTATFASSNANDPLVVIKNTTNDVNGARLQFVKDKGAAGADGDDIGLIEFVGDNDAQQQTSFAKILAEVADASDGTETGKLSFHVAENDGTLTSGMDIVGLGSDGNVTVDIATHDGAAGGLKLGGTLVTPTAAELNLMDASGGANPSDGAWVAVRRIAKATINSDDHSSTSGGGVHSLGVNIPDHAIILGGWVDIQTAFNSGGSATVGLTVASSTPVVLMSQRSFASADPTNDALWNAASQASPPSGLGMGPIRLLSNYGFGGQRTDSSGAITLTVASADLTAGVADVYVEYMIGKDD